MNEISLTVIGFFLIVVIGGAFEFWLVVRAYQRLEAEQRRILSERDAGCYGDDPRLPQVAAEGQVESGASAPR